MQILNHQPVVKCFGNGFQLTFPNKYTVIVKNGMGTKSTFSLEDKSDLQVIMGARFGGYMTPDCEVEVYDKNKTNITDKFGESNSLGFVTPIQLVDLLYVVSNLK